MNAKKRICLAAVAGIAIMVAGQHAQAATITLGTLDTLLGTSVTVGSAYGGYTYSFTNYIPTGPAPAASAITVYADNDTPGEPGILFVDHWTAFPGQTVDSIIDFSVTAPKGVLIDDDYLATTGGVTSDSSWFVDEEVTNALGDSLANFEVNSSHIVSGQVSDNYTFLTPETTLNISKDISLQGLTGTATISDIYQGFSQTASVPLPAAAWGGMGLLGLLGAAKARARRMNI